MLRVNNYVQSLRRRLIVRAKCTRGMLGNLCYGFAAEVGFAAVLCPAVNISIFKFGLGLPRRNHGLELANAFGV